MGERIIRPGIRTSDKTAANVRDGGWMAQVFFDWLLTLVDDYGRYDARPAVLRAEMFPLLLDAVREADVQRCLESCQAAGLIRLYMHDRKPYLEVKEFRQRMRAKASKWPAPDGHCHDIVVTMPTYTETETETDTETDTTTETDTVPSSCAAGPDPANAIAAEVGIAANIGEKQRGMLRRLISIDGYERARDALRYAVGEKGIGVPACIVYAEKMVAGDKARRDRDGDDDASIRERAKRIAQGLSNEQ